MSRQAVRIAASMCALLTFIGLAACQAPPSATPRPPTQTQAASTPTPTPSPTTTPTLTATAGPSPTGEMPITPAASLPAPNVELEGIAFYLSPSLGGDAAAEVVPERDDGNPGLVMPHHVRIDFPDYAIASRVAEAHLAVTPVETLDALRHKAVIQRVEALKQLLELRPAHIPGATNPAAGIPRLPLSWPYSAVQFFHAQIAYMEFHNGLGVRYLTAYTMDLAPITNGSLLYVFQGLTDDGAYFVSLYLPITHPDLPDDVSQVPGWDDYATFAENFPAYLDDALALLNGSNLARFEPNLTLLDSLAQSIRVED